MVLLHILTAHASCAEDLEVQILTHQDFKYFAYSSTYTLVARRCLILDTAKVYISKLFLYVVLHISEWSLVC